MLKKFKSFISVDFDGVLATYHRPWKYDKLGVPNQDVIDAVNYFYEDGHHINIFTGRQRTPKLIQWLAENKVNYHTINVNPQDHPLASTFKPYFNLILDDKSVRYNCNEKKSKDELIEEMKQVLNWSQE